MSSAVRVSLSISPGLPHGYARVHAAVRRVVGWAALRRTPTSRPASGEPSRLDGPKGRMPGCLRLERDVALVIC